jgi:hypothetical protein
MVLLVAASSLITCKRVKKEFSYDQAFDCAGSRRSDGQHPPGLEVKSTDQRQCDFFGGVRNWHEAASVGGLVILSTPGEPSYRRGIAATCTSDQSLCGLLHRLRHARGRIEPEGCPACCGSSCSA